MLDIHTRNIVFKDAHWDRLTEQDLFTLLKKPETGKVTSHDGRPLGEGTPRYLVLPSSLRISKNATSRNPEIRLIDLGEAFTRANRPKTLHTPLALRAPEVIFEDEWDYRVDLWSAGCTVWRPLHAITIS